VEYEVFPNPLVKRVVFQIRFPNLFYLADRIGDFQVKVMKEFPDSQLLFRREFHFVSSIDKENVERQAEESKRDDTVPIWQFRSEEGVQLGVCSNSLSLVSDQHKSYNSGDKRFRDIIDFTCKRFFESTSIPVIKRVGLRYIDEGPVPSDLNGSFSEWYNTAFSACRFPMDSISEMSCMAEIERGTSKLRYIEALKGAAERRKIVLDFDAWSEDVDPDNLLSTTDLLHEVLWNEFRSTVKEPVLNYMRKPREEANVPK